MSDKNQQTTATTPDEALERVREYVAALHKKPLVGLDPDSIHIVHCGTEFEAQLNRSDLMKIIALADEFKAEIERLNDIIDNPKLAGLALHRRTMEIGLKGGPIQIFAEAFAEQFKGSNALNYIEMTMRPEGNDIGQLAVTVQRVAGKTPHQLRMHAEAKIPAAIEAMREAAIAEIPAAAEYCYPGPVIADIRKLDANAIIQGLEKA